MVTINERLAIIEVKIANLTRMCYFLTVVILGLKGYDIIGPQIQQLFSVLG